MGSVPELVTCIGPFIHKVVLINDPVGDSVAIGVCSEERMIDIDTRVDNDCRETTSIDAVESRIIAEVVNADQVTGFIELW